MHMRSMHHNHKPSTVLCKQPPYLPCIHGMPLCTCHDREEELRILRGEQEVDESKMAPLSDADDTDTDSQLSEDQGPVNPGARPGGGMGRPQGLRQQQQQQGLGNGRGAAGQVRRGVEGTESLGLLMSARAMLSTCGWQCCMVVHQGHCNLP